GGAKKEPWSPRAEPRRASTPPAPRGETGDRAGGPAGRLPKRVFVYWGNDRRSAAERDSGAADRAQVPGMVLSAHAVRDRARDLRWRPPGDEAGLRLGRGDVPGREGLDDPPVLLDLLADPELAGVVEQPRVELHDVAADALAGQGLRVRLRAVGGQVHVREPQRAGAGLVVDPGWTDVDDRLLLQKRLQLRSLEARIRLL